MEYCASMASMSDEDKKGIKILCDEFHKYNHIDSKYYERYDVKRGLRNADGTGVVAGLTQICNVHGYIMDEGEKSAVDGQLFYRGINVKDIVNGCLKENRYGYEEVVWLLLFGRLPNKEQLSLLRNMISECRELPFGFAEDMMIKAPTPNIMSMIERSIVALYAYDEDAENLSVENLIRQSIELIARVPTILVHAYQIKKRIYNHQSMVFHPIDPTHSTAQHILSMIRDDRTFTEDEAHLLDICLMLHAEHGGGNNSTFACRVLSSSGTDTYSAIAAGVGALKGPKHGGANLKTMEMLNFMMRDIEHWDRDAEVETYLRKLLNKEAGDRSGLIYGLGHAVYTKSDPRAVIIKQNAMKLAEKRGFEREFLLLDAVERIAPRLIAEKTSAKEEDICANVDLYSGMVYKMINIPQDLFTPLFAIARMAGWCAHRIEEVTNANRIIRPAYKAIVKNTPYVPINER